MDVRHWVEAETVLLRAAKVEPYDLQTLSALKNVCQKIGERPRIVAASKRLAMAYVANGQNDRAISEFQWLAKEVPNDKEVTQGLIDLKRGEKKQLPPPPTMTMSRVGPRVTEGNKRLGQFLIEEHLLKSNDVWLLLHLLGQINADANGKEPAVPFLFLASVRNMIPLENLILALVDRFRMPYVPLDIYDVDHEAAKDLPHDVTLPHCVLAFDRIGRKTLVATSNPFDEDVRTIVTRTLKQNVLWYLGSPATILLLVRETSKPAEEKA